jgi:predicted ATPase/class 3 adenylate cyclase
VGSPRELPAGTVTLLFSDIERSTALARTLGDAWPEVLGAHRAILRGAVEAHGGIELATEGDGLIAAFPRAGEAIAAAADGQRALAAHPWPVGAPVLVRMGLHTGEPVLTAEGYEGLDMHRGARVMAAGHGGQVLLTGVVRETVGERLPGGVAVMDLGVHALRDFPRRERLFQLVIEGLPATFPPLRTDSGTATNLPRPPTRLLGRDREAARVADLVCDGARLVSLTGPGGVGKTRLALHVARELLPRFEGVFLVDLAAVRDPALVLPAVAAALGVREGGGDSVADALVRELGDRRILLVLDNLEQVVVAATALGDLLARTRGLRLLVTSRVPLRLSAERVISVAPLAAGDAAELFVERAGAAGHDAEANEEDAEAVAAICSRLDGLPLAIELAAARTPALPPRALLRRLDRRLELLNLGARDVHERQSTLLATLDWSHDLLNERERMLLRRLAVFAGGFAAEAAEEVCGGETVLDGLAGLVEHSLLRRDVAPDGEPRFAMLETIREYATRKLRASNEARAVRARHASYMAALVERAGPDVPAGRDAAAYDLLDLEHDNLRAALDWAHGAARHDLELRLAGALWWFWLVRGHATEGLARLDAALVHAGATAGPAYATALRARGLLLQELDRLEEAEADGRKLLAIADATEDVALRARAIDLLANIVNRRGDYERARRLNEEVAALYRKAGDAVLLSGALDGLADVALKQSRFQDAAALSTEALEIRRAIGDVAGVATALSNLGSALLGLGRADEAADLFAESLRNVQAIRYSEGIAYALEGLGAVAAALGRPKRAARLLGAADAALRASRTNLQAFEARRYEQVVAGLRDELGNEAFAAAWDEGKAMTPDDPSAFALGEPAPSGGRA